MTFLEKVLASVAAPETDDDRRKARAKAADIARDSRWLAAVLEQHVAIEQALAGVRAATDASGRRSAQRWLSTLVTGHSIAEEAVLYPAMGRAGQKLHSMMACREQSDVKFELAALETLAPMSQANLDKLELLQTMLVRHMFAEEKHWFPALARQGTPAEQLRLSSRFEQEFERYMGVDADLS